MKKLRVAHFGIAHDHSGVTMECARKYPDVYEVVGICEPDEAMRAEYGGDPAYVGQNAQCGKGPGRQDLRQ